MAHEWSYIKSSIKHQQTKGFWLQGKNFNSRENFWKELDVNRDVNLP